MKKATIVKKDKMQKISLDLTVPMLKLLKKMSRQTGFTISYLIRKFIADGITQSPWNGSYSLRK